MAKRQAKRKKPANPIVDRHIIRPTPERAAMNDVDRTAIVYRFTPVIRTLFDAGKLTGEQFDALLHYRNKALQAQDDCAQESTLAPSRIMGGGGGSSSGGRIPRSILMDTEALVETARIEAALFTLKLVDIARAVAVEDMTLTRWAISQCGGREQYRGDKADMVPRDPLAVRFALHQLVRAAGAIVR